MKKLIDLLLRNRFWRFLTTVVMFIVVIVPMSVLEIVSTNMDWTWSIPDGILFITPTLVFAICIVGQLFGDVMNVDTWLNNGFVTFLKRVIFFAVTVAALVLGVGLTVATGNIAKLAKENASPIAMGVCIASMYAPAFALLAYVFGYIRYSKNYHAESEKKWLPFFFPFSYVAGIVVGIILSLIFKLANLGGDVIALVLPLVTLVPVVVSIIACFKTGTWPFEEEAPCVSSSGGGYSGGYSDYTDTTNQTNTTPPADEYRGVKCCKYCRYWKQHVQYDGRLVTVCQICGVPTGEYSQCDHFQN